MAKVSLRAYDREIEALIEHEQRVDEAIAHCRHILKTYPKHLETYRLLGKAYLEGKRYQEAVDIFERVLVAVPEDFVCHVGMSIISDDQGRLDEAIWHMERAFEMQPSNAAIQGELQRLFARRDGVEPPKIRLTRGALARMYMQGELYAQAMSETRAVLGGDPKRTDMQTLLAKACYLSGQKVEATSICTDLLSRYPYCLDANRLMAELLPGTQRADAAQEYRQRVIELDPYAAFAGDSLFHLENIADGAVSLERLEYVGPSAEQPATLGLGPTAAPASFAHIAGEPDWLASGGAPQIASEKPEATAPEIPDFLREAGWSEKGAESAPLTAGTPEEEPLQAAVPANLPDWIQAFAPAEADRGESAAEGAAASLETPDWLADLGSASSQEPSSAPAEQPASNAPDWLQGLRDHDIDEPETLPKAVASAQHLEASEEALVSEPDESPIWLKDFATDLETPVTKTLSVSEGGTTPPVQEPSEATLGALGTSPQEQDDAMAWLESLAAKHGAKSEELVTNPEDRTGATPDWINRARTIGEQEPEVSAKPPGTAMPEPPASDLDLTGKWLSSLQASAPSELEPTKVVQGPESGQSLDWISALSEQGDFTAPAAEEDNQERPIMEAGEAPSWLADAREEPAAKLGVEEAPSWLGSAAPITPATEAGAPPSPAEAQVDLPEWLAGLDQEKAAPSPGTASGEDIPLWLRPENEPTPSAAEPTHPADWQPAEPPASPAAMPVAEKAEPAPAVTSVPEAASAASPAISIRPPAPSKSRPTAPASREAGAPQVTLQGAQTELARGNIAAALDVYARLIRKGKSLEEIIRDLRDALYRYPVEVPIWQALGDAYMRANRLQEALDAYTKAEELLR